MEPTVAKALPDLDRAVGTAMLSSVMVYEGIGPFLARPVVNSAGEIHLLE